MEHPDHYSFLGKMGIGQSAARGGDAIAVLFGGGVPFVLRPSEGPPLQEQEPPGGEGEKREGTQVESRDAARALARPSFAAPTAATKARGVAAGEALPRPASNRMSTLPSRTTIGYAKGRKVSSTLRTARAAPAPAPASGKVHEGEKSEKSEEASDWKKEEEETEKALLELLLKRDEEVLGLGKEEDVAKNPFEGIFEPEEVLLDLD